MQDQRLTHTVIILDLDGTLVDSAQDLTLTLNTILTREGLPPVPPEEVRTQVGHGAMALLKAGFKAAGRPFPDGEDATRLLDEFLSYYEAHIADATVPFPGCIDFLETTRAMGSALAVCTNKIERLTFPLLDALQLRQYFDEVICRDSLPEYKPSPLPLQEIMRRTGRAQAVMVGDTMTDVDAARAAQIPCAFMTFGYGALDDPLPKNEQRVESFDTLLEVILGWV